MTHGCGVDGVAVPDHSCGEADPHIPQYAKMDPMALGFFLDYLLRLLYSLHTIKRVTIRPWTDGHGPPPSLSPPS